MNQPESTVLLLPPGTKGPLGKQNGAPQIDKPKEEEQRTTVKKKLFLEIYRKTLGSVQATADKVGIERTTYYLWMNGDPEFAQAIRDAWKFKLEDVEQLANSLILDKDGAMIRHFLDRRHPLYKPKVKVETALPGEISAEQDLVEFLKDDKRSETKIHREQAEDKKQAGTAGAVQTEPGATILLGPKNPAQPGTESKAEGHK